MEIAVRRMQKKDIAHVYEIECVCFRTPWSKLSLQSELRNVVSHYVVLTADEKVVGFGGMWVIYDEAHITNIAVLPEYRRMGHARRIMLALMECAVSRGATAMTLEVRENNLGAQALYGQFGFAQNGYRPRYYEDTGEGALLLWNRDVPATLASFSTIC